MGKAINNKIVYDESDSYQFDEVFDETQTFFCLQFNLIKKNREFIFKINIFVG